MKRKVKGLISGLCAGLFGVCAVFPGASAFAADTTAEIQKKNTDFLDRGGILYSRVNREYIVEQQTFFKSMLGTMIRAEVDRENNARKNAVENPYERFLDRLFMRLGISDIESAGLSAIRLPDGQILEKMYLAGAANPEMQKKLLWNLHGVKPHAFEKAVLIPESTVAFLSFDLNAKDTLTFVNATVLEMLLSPVESIRHCAKETINENERMLKRGMEFSRLFSTLTGVTAYLALNENDSENVTMEDFTFESIGLIFDTTDSKLWDFYHKNFFDTRLGKNVKVQKDCVIFDAPGESGICCMLRYANKQIEVFISSKANVEKKLAGTYVDAKHNIAKSKEFKEISARLQKEGNSFFFFSSRLIAVFEHPFKKWREDGNRYNPFRECYPEFPERLSEFLGTQSTSYGVAGKYGDEYRSMSVNGSRLLSLLGLANPEYPSIFASCMSAAFTIFTGTTLPYRVENANERSQLKQLALGLTMYCLDTQSYPEEMGIAGLRKLQNESYLDAKQFLFNGKSQIAEENCPFVYLGSGIDYENNPSAPLLFLKPSVQRQDPSLNRYYSSVDGAVHLCPIKYASASEFIDKFFKENPDAVTAKEIEKYRAAAKKYDAYLSKLPEQGKAMH